MQEVAKDLGVTSESDEASDAGLFFQTENLESVFGQVVAGVEGEG
jgi:hypothetical protein